MKEESVPISSVLSIEESKQASARKKDHIDLAFEAQTKIDGLDDRFYYEPLLSGHPVEGSLPDIPFLGKVLRCPIWVSSMTGGAKYAFQINTALAKACRHFGMGMGLGSCRSLLYDDAHFDDFNVRHLIGDELPLFANLGIAQLEELLDKNALHLIEEMLGRLQADGLIIHLNPLQEWFQPEGDRIKHPPLFSLRKLLDKATYPVIVKEVGQGMGPESLKFLLNLPLAAVDFGAAGGTNFAMLENLRRQDDLREHWAPIVLVGHDATTMVKWVNDLVASSSGPLPCGQVIISGGVKDFLDGHYLINKCQIPALYGQASSLLRYALQGDEALLHYLQAQIRGLEMARAFLHVK